MNTKDLYSQIQAKKSMLCVGLDTDFSKMPAHIQKLGGTARSLYEFNKADRKSVV